VIFGKALPASRRLDWSLLGIRADGPALSEVLRATQAVGWQAEGVVRVYAVEEMVRSRGAFFSRLTVGPATANGVPLEGAFNIEQLGQSSSVGVIDGIVPLSAT
jgi:hypothetical protein